jgi:hypothetical protein
MANGYSLLRRKSIEPYGAARKRMEEIRLEWFRTGAHDDRFANRESIGQATHCSAIGRRENQAAAQRSWFLGNIP